jgi:hypothetical protein
MGRIASGRVVARLRVINVAASRRIGRRSFVACAGPVGDRPTTSFYDQ